MPKKTNILKFKPTADLYFDMADEKLDEGDYESAVCYFYRSFKVRDSADALLALGETYCEMGEPEEGLKYLLMALDKEPASEDICQAVANCFSCMDDDETAFFYFEPGLNIKNYRRLIEKKWQKEDEPKIRLLENNDEMIISIAAKLLISGDTVYAKEMLLTVKPDSEYYTNANNILALSALDADNPAEALLYINRALDKKDTVELRCTRIIALYMLKDYTAMNADVAAVETRKTDLDGHRAAAMAYIRIENALLAEKHLKSLLDGGVLGRDYLISYALARYNNGDIDGAKQEIVSATRLYPADVAIEEIARLMGNGKKLKMFPFMPDKTAQKWLKDIDAGLNIISSQDGSDLTDDPVFIKKIEWLYQSKYVVRQGKASLVLAKKPAWHKFLKTLLLDNYMDLPSKKLTLYALLLQGGHNRIGIVLDGLYARLKVRYPMGADHKFRAAYCLAYATFAFSDSEFEDRLYAEVNTLVKRYNQPQFDKTKIETEDALAAMIFYACNQNRNINVVHCCHIFNCNEEIVREYLKLFGIETAE